ncbi:hypothetical protein ACWED2_28250 [Amycolatopsis sp. NPDC005003]
MDNEPVLSRPRVLAGLLITVAGTVWAVGDADELRRAGRLALIILPVLFVVFAVGMVVRAAMPAGTAAGPVTLLVFAAGGLAAASVVFGWVSAANLAETAAVAVTGGGMAVALSRRRMRHTLDVIIRRRTAVLTTRKHLRIFDYAPAKSVVRAILGGEVHLDLAAAEYPAGVDNDNIVVDITAWYGRVVISVPAGWHVEAGRVELARRMRYEGELDTPDPAATRRVVLNIQGLGGFLWLRRGL